MFKFALATLLSFLIAAAPVESSARTVHKSTVSKKKVSAKPARAKRQVVSKSRVASASRQTMVRRTIMVKGKRKVVYQRVLSAGVTRAIAPAYIAPRSFGDRAGLHLTRDPIGLASNVAFVIDQNNAEVLFDKNSDVALPIASITKLMTGLIVVQARQDMNEVLTITEDDVDHEKFTRSRLSVGTRMTRANLLHIALMSSENRAAAALGRNFPGGIAGFVAAMNAKAQELGMTETRYVDSSGLSSKNVASARDLARLAMFAYNEPLLREYSTDPGSTVDAGGGRTMNYNNTNYLVRMPDWDIGLQKTGFINEAGRCLVMQAIIQGRAVIMVFLDSKGKQSRTADAGRVRRWLEALKPAGIS
jgi:D-alanyl-D-alanine endopeptidase (penicillin-binding protein 7)